MLTPDFVTSEIGARSRGNGKVQLEIGRMALQFEIGWLALQSKIGRCYSTGSADGYPWGLDRTRLVPDRLPFADEESAD